MEHLAPTTAAERKKHNAAVLCILGSIPVIFFTAANLVEAIVGDFSSDPDYSYLFNALNITELRAPAQFTNQSLI